MNICYSVNSAYVKYLYVSLTSLFLNNREAKIRVFVFHADLDEKEEKCLSDLAAGYRQELFCIPVDRSLFKEFRSEPYPLEAYFRLCMPYLLPKDIGRMLYLDVDTIVEKPLSGFYETDLKGDYAAVCRDLKLIEKEEDGVKQMIRDESSTYFNSGVMLCDLEKIRNDLSFEDFTEYARVRDFYLPYADQDILNGLFQGKVTYADPDRYNYLVNMEMKCGYSESLSSCAVILHFAGVCPWHRVKPAPSHKRWWYYARQTPFYEELLEMKLKGTSLPKRLQ